jgi:hypothetical protein
MSFSNVDNEERHSIFVLLIQFVERGNLPAKWWSSVAAKDQRNRFASPER